MGLGDILDDIGDGVASGLEATTRGLNFVDRYVNPFHVEFSPDGDVDESRNSFLGEAVQHGSERFFAGYEWVYDNAISQPISTALLMGYRGEIFSASEWSRTWRAAEHISPGQTAAIPLVSLQSGMDLQGVADAAVESPLRYYEPPASMLPPEWDQLPEQERQRILREMGMPVDPRGGNQYIRHLADTYGWFSAMSGTADFALRFFGDPLVIAGKGIRAARLATTTRVRPREGWTPERIDALINGSRFRQLEDFTWANRNNPALNNNTDMALRTAMGPRYGAVISVLQSRNELRDFFRVGMGDVAAQERLSAANALARQRLEADTARLADMDITYARYAANRDRRMVGLVEREQERLQAAIDADTALVTRYEQILEHADEIDQLHLSRWQYQAARNRTEAQRAYTAGPARDRRAGRDFRRRITPVVAPEGTSVPVQSGIVQTRLWGVGDFFSTPVTLVRMVRNAHPNGFVEIDNGRALAAENITEIRAQIARIPGLEQGLRQNMLNQYLRLTSEGARKEWLDDLGRLASAKVAEKYGLSAEQGREIFEAVRLRRQGELDNMAQYSAAQRDGVRVDAFEVDGRISIEPHTVTRLQNNYVLDDLATLDRVLRRHGSMFRALRERGAGNSDWIMSAGDSLNQLWKFATLFRLGYIPRTIGDDIASQWARLRSVAMAIRIGYGVKNGITNLAHRSTRTMDDMAIRIREEEIRYANEELALLEPDLQRLRAEAESFPEGSDALLRLEDQAAQLENFRDLATRSIEDLQARRQKVFQGSSPVTIDGTRFPAALAGSQRAEYWAARISPSRAYDQLFKTSKQMVHANLMRSFDNGARPIQAIDDEAKHAAAWSHAINAQIVGDRMQRMLVEGISNEGVVRWLRSNPSGKAYWERLGIQAMTTPEDIVARARAEVDEYLPTPEIRAQALTPEGVTADFLRKAIQNPLHRPTVHMANVGQAAIGGYRAMNRVMQFFYDTVVNLPTRALSRHPLFNQLYEGHLKAIVRQRTQQGAAPRTVDEIERAAETSRRLAERDMKRLTFDITHQSDAAAALRFVSPFFSATAESFQRWARVIADRPEILGYAAKFYNAPAYSGHMQTSDGNPIFADGTYIDPVTGERKLASKNDRWIVGRMPEWLAESPFGIAFGVERSSGNFMLSQNSMNMVTQGDPWFSPGFGPIVQIPVGEFVKDKPKEAELARHLGILPFGPSTAANPLMRAAQSGAPSTIRNFLTAFDTSDYRYQQVKMQIMQRAIFEHTEGNKPMPSAQEIAARTRNYWLFSAASSFLQPMATQRKDPYQFYRDQYRNLQRQNPETADMEFLTRFGEEYFIFAQSMSKHEAGVPPTEKGVELSQRYADLIAENPELGALIIGPEGQGPFSPEAYAYQLNTPLVPGDAESQRRRLSAEEAAVENQRRLGWAKYTAFMHYITNELEKRGLVTLDDKDAEDLAKRRKAFITLFAEPMVNGQANEFYNAAWSEDWFSFDARKYERLVPALEQVANTVLASDPDRGDMRSFLIYAEGRRAVQQTLSEREFTTLGAEANRDLRRSWTTFVSGLIGRDTTFGDLHSRYLARDLGVDIEEETAIMASEAAT